MWSSSWIQAKLRVLFLVLPLSACCLAADWPTPPSQYDRWDPPAGHLVDPKLDHACQLMFDAGIPDPRGCEYREISVPVYDDGWGPWDDRVPVPSERLHGWLLPEDWRSATRTRYAIGWNGLIYPVLWAGGLADVHADATVMVPVPPEADAQDRGWGPDASHKPPGCHLLIQLHQHFIQPLHVLMLVRLGLRQEAAQAVQRLTASGRCGGAEMAPGGDPYPFLAASWVAGLYQRALAARCLGDDAIALGCLTWLAECLPKLQDASSLPLEQIRAKTGALANWSQWSEVLRDQRL